MRVPLAALALFALFAMGVQQPACRTINLTLPHELREGETACLQVTAGVIPRGAEIEITPPAGRPLGTISPYGIRAGEEAGTYPVPLPAEAISGRRVTVRLSLRFRGEQRAPTKDEVKMVRVKIGKTS